VGFACHPSSKPFYPTFFYLFLSAPQLYLFVIISSYGTAQRQDHDQYDRIYDPSQPLTAENIPLDTRTDPWDSRPSVDAQDKYHVRNRSSVSDLNMNISYQKPVESYPSDGYTDNPERGAPKF
jgi:hypothetical protein